MRNVCMWSFFTSETSEKIYKSTFSYQNVSVEHIFFTQMRVRKKTVHSGVLCST